MKTYYFLSINESICCTVDIGSFTDFFSKKIGNYFDKKEDAEKFLFKTKRNFYPLMVGTKMWFITTNGEYKSFIYKDDFVDRFRFATSNIYNSKIKAKIQSENLKQDYHNERYNLTIKIQLQQDGQTI